jgi:hypothetical protein
MSLSISGNQTNLTLTNHTNRHETVVHFSQGNESSSIDPLGQSCTVTASCRGENPCYLTLPFELRQIRVMGTKLNVCISGIKNSGRQLSVLNFGQDNEIKFSDNELEELSLEDTTNCRFDLYEQEPSRLTTKTTAATKILYPLTKAPICIFCCKNEVTVVVQPCGCWISCASCWKKHLSSNSNKSLCPLCRRSAKSNVTVRICT